MSTTETQLEAVRAAVEPAVGALGLDLYDVELLGGRGGRTLRVTVTRGGGVDLDAITAATQAVSPLVDTATDISGSFLLEVTSPGIERTLRRPEHFAGAIGEEVSVKFHTDTGPRRVRGRLREFDGTQATVAADDGDEHTIALDAITQARTVFEWGPTPRPGKSRARAKGKA